MMIDYMGNENKENFECNEIIIDILKILISEGISVLSRAGESLSSISSKLTSSETDSSAAASDSRPVRRRQCLACNAADPDRTCRNAGLYHLFQVNERLRL